MTEPKLPLTHREQKKQNRKVILSQTKRVLTEEELARLERKARTLQNRRGRKNPVALPDKLARTSAFAPRRQGLITDSNFKRIYEVPGYSVVEVRGRELGSQHRDAIYALFRLKPQKVTILNPDYRAGTFKQSQLTFYELQTTWRDIIQTMGRTQHVNNLLSLQNVLSDIKQVVFFIHKGRSLSEMEKILEKRRANLAIDAPGSISSIFEDIAWEGLTLDSNVSVRFGASILEMIEKAHLVSVNGDVQFALKSDFAKSFWPFIDSQPSFKYIDEVRLAQLVGRDLWHEKETSATRAQFRKVCRQAFDDMKIAGGLKSWKEEVVGSGRAKTRRYLYEHALMRQMELNLLDDILTESRPQKSGEPTPKAGMPTPK